MREQDRSSLVEMLVDAADVSTSTIGMYRIPRATPDVLLVAWIDDRLVGMLNASYVADFSDKPAFDRFHLPLLPHAFLDRIHVHPTARRHRVGCALADGFIRTAQDRRCTFAGGLIDTTSDPTGRIAFFEWLGFEVLETPSAYTAGLHLLP